MKRIFFLLLFLSVAFESQAESYRIVSLAPSTTEVLFALGLGGSIVGVDEYSNYPEEAAQIERVGSFNKPHMERIISLRPDYILVNVDINKDSSDYLEGLGARIIKVSPKSVEELCDKIMMLGITFHKEDRARVIVEDIRKRIRSVSRNIGKTRPKVFVQLFNDPLITVSSFIGDLIRLAGGENIAWDIKGDTVLFSYEVLIQRNPDVIIVIGFSGESNLPDSINAVKRNKIFKDLNPDILLRPGPRAIEMVEKLNRIFYEKN